MDMKQEADKRLEFIKRKGLVDEYDEFYRKTIGGELNGKKL